MEENFIKQTKKPILQIIAANKVSPESYPLNYNGEKYIIFKRWNNIVEAKNKLGLEHSHINNSLKKEYSCQGYYWVYEENWYKEWEPSLKIQKRNRVIYAYSLESGEFKGKFIKAIIASRFLGVSVSNIRLCAREDHPKESTKGFVFTYTPKNKKELDAPFTENIVEF